MSTRRWSSEVMRSPHGLVYRHHPRIAADLLDDGCAWGDRDHLVDARGRFTFAETAAASRGLARRLAQRGVGRGDRVLLRGPASANWVIAFWGVLCAGGVAVPVNPRWGPVELAHATVLTNPVLVLSDDHDSAVPWSEIGTATGDAPHVLVAQSDAAAIIFTAGTTGLPKGATLSQAALIAGVQNQLAPRRMLPGQLRDGPGPISLMSIPPFHIGGLTALTANLVCGGTLVFTDPVFDATDTLAAIKRERVSTWGAIPTMLTRVLDAAERKGITVDSLRTITIGGASVPAGLPARIAVTFPSAAQGGGNSYGMTEAGGHIATAPRGVAAQRPGSSGRPLPAVELRIEPYPSVDPPSGEILIRSPSAMSGYWGQPDDSTRDADGWIHSGDLGYVDEDGFLYITGRVKDVIIRGGENVAAPHVENHLLAHPAVGATAVVGLPHPDLGEEVAAVVQPADGKCAADLSVKDLEAFLRDRLSHFQVPTRWWIRDNALPLSAVGKVLKKDLIAMWPAEC